MQIPWRRAGATSSTVGRIILHDGRCRAADRGRRPCRYVGITGIAIRDAANTFNTLPVGQLGAAPIRSVALRRREGKPITYFYPYDVYRVPVAYNQISPVMRDAIVAIEDDTFCNRGRARPARHAPRTGQ